MLITWSTIQEVSGVSFSKMAACSFNKLTTCSSLLQKSCSKWKECTQNGLLNSSCVVSGMGTYLFTPCSVPYLKRQRKVYEDHLTRLHFVFVHKISFCICLCVRIVLQKSMCFDLSSAWVGKALNPNSISQLYLDVISLCQAYTTPLSFRIQRFGFFFSETNNIWTLQKKEVLTEEPSSH